MEETFSVRSVPELYNENPMSGGSAGDRPDLSSERAPHRDNTANFRQKIISDHKSQNKLDTKTY
jgi:hypothetical protein